jgi:hypothetical protein
MPHLPPRDLFVAEPLESRRLLAASLQGSTLFLNPDGLPGGEEMRIRSSSFLGMPTIRATVNGISSDFFESQVDAIVFVGGNADDVLRLDEVRAGNAVTMVGGSGDDEMIIGTPGGSYAEDIASPVQVFGGPNFDEVVIHDDGDTTAARNDYDVFIDPTSGNTRTVFELDSATADATVQWNTEFERVELNLSASPINNIDVQSIAARTFLRVNSNADRTAALVSQVDIEDDLAGSSIFFDGVDTSLTLSDTGQSRAYTFGAFPTFFGGGEFLTGDAFAANQTIGWSDSSDLLFAPSDGTPVNAATTIDFDAITADEVTVLGADRRHIINIGHVSDPDIPSDFTLFGRGTDDRVVIGNGSQDVSGITGDIFFDPGFNTTNAVDELIYNGQLVDGGNWEVVPNAVGVNSPTNTFRRVGVGTQQITAENGVDRMELYLSDLGSSTSAVATDNLFVPGLVAGLELFIDAGNGLDTTTVGSPTNGLRSFDGVISFPDNVDAHEIVIDDTAASAASGLQYQSVGLRGIEVGRSSGPVLPELRVELPVTGFDATFLASDGDDELFLSDQNTLFTTFDLGGGDDLASFRRSGVNGEVIDFITVIGGAGEDTFIWDERGQIGATPSGFLNDYGLTLLANRLVTDRTDGNGFRSDEIDYELFEELFIDLPDTGDNPVVVPSLFPTVTARILASDGEDPLNVPDLRDIQGELVFDGGDGFGTTTADDAVLQNPDPFSGLIYTLEETTVPNAFGTRLDIEGAGGVTLTRAGDVTLRGNDYTDVLIVDTLFEDSADTFTALLGEGDDEVIINRPGFGTSFVIGDLFIDGEEGNDSLIYDDSDKTAPFAGPPDVSARYDVFGFFEAEIRATNGSADVAWRSFADIDILTSPGDDTVNLDGVDPLFLDTGPGRDSISVDDTAGAVELDAGPGFDNLSLGGGSGFTTQVDLVGDQQFANVGTATPTVLRLGGYTDIDDLFWQGGGIDVGTHAMAIENATVDYFVIGQFSGEEAVGELLRFGYNGGAWNGGNGSFEGGIFSRAAGASGLDLGYGNAGDLFPQGFWLGQRTIDPDDTLIRFTRTADANLDGTVNLADFGRLRGGFGQSDMGWSRGDFNYDGTVNLADFGLLRANFGTSLAPPAVGLFSGVPIGGRATGMVRGR